MKYFFYCLTLLFAAFIYSCSKEKPHSPKKYTIEQFLNTTSYSGGSYTWDEKRILLSSDETGVYNVISVPTNGGKQTRLTNSEDKSIHVLSGFPHDDRFLFTSDEHGNERNHIYLREADGTVRDLTPFAEARAEFYGWNYGLTGFYFGSNQRDPKFMDLYEVDLETLTPRLLYKNEAGWKFGSISPNKRYMTLGKVINANSSEMYLYNFDTNTLKNLTPHEGDISYASQGFSIDSKELYFLTDENHDFSYLKKYNLETGATETVEKYDWDIAGSNFSHTGKYRVISINQDGMSVVKIYDQKAKKPLVLPKMPEGEITSVLISRSEKSMLFFVNGDRSPNNLYIYNFEKGTYRKLTESMSPDIDTQDLVEAETVRYPSYDGKLIPALFFKPKNISEGQKVPALILVHGGPGGQSRKGYNFLVQYLVNHGYAVLAVNNRGSSGYGKAFYKAADLKHGEADLDDCMCAKGYLVNTGFIDENKVGIIGGSYGGYMTLAALAFRPEEMAIGIDIFGVSNWVRTLKSIPSWWESERQSLYMKIGNPETNAEYLESISPLFHADKIRKPLLVIQGANDPRVLKAESDQIIEAISKNDIAYRYVVFEDEGHGFSKKQNRLTVAKVILEFLDEHLK